MTRRTAQQVEADKKAKEKIKNTLEMQRLSDRVFLCARIGDKTIFSLEGPTRPLLKHAEEHVVKLSRMHKDKELWVSMEFENRMSGVESRMTYCLWNGKETWLS